MSARGGQSIASYEGLWQLRHGLHNRGGHRFAPFAVSRSQISVTDKAEGARPLSGGFILQVTLLFAEALPIGRPGVCMDSPLETSHEFAQYSALRLFLMRMRNPETVYFRR